MKNIICLILFLLISQKTFLMEIGIEGIGSFEEIVLQDFNENEIDDKSDLEEVEINPPHQSLSRKIYNLCCCFSFCNKNRNTDQ